VVFHAPASLELVVSTAPGAPSFGVGGKFVKGLAKVLRTGETPMHDTCLSAFLGHRCNAAIGRHFVGASITISLGTEGGQEPRREGLSRTGEGLKQHGVGVRRHSVFDLLVQLIDRLLQHRDLFGEHLYDNGGRFDQGVVAGE
jgi:hypothetical protein